MEKSRIRDKHPGSATLADPELFAFAEPEPERIPAPN
jgi:hypothetical protein